ncbi:putative Transmembrane protease serine 6 [Hypsibius exemplaris]|uniref:Transmembrane protease serine 6 n=1 Tax=Hypsibius exemplaris TaxID=2072580 RepID=A0A1W0WZT9_HYPEX|nr:putative Transmembrane protease serine 6 [Hypsibius exemplaris]
MSTIGVLLLLGIWCGQSTVHGGPVGTTCSVNDAFGSTGNCVDSSPNSQATPCLFSLAPSAQCDTPLQCCYLNLNSFGTPNVIPTLAPVTQSPINPFTSSPTVSPLNPFTPAPTLAPWNPFLTTLSSYIPTPSPFDPFFPITPAPGPGGARLCGRLRSDTGFDSKRMDDQPFANSAEGERIVRSLNWNRNVRMKRIVGGAVVPDGEYCYQAAIVVGNAVIATGVLISEDYVLTSYSGIAKADPTGRTLKILLGGTANLSPLLQAGLPGYSVIRIVKAVNYNPSYGPGFPINDAALIQINKGTGLDWTRLCTICLTSLPIAQESCSRIVVSGYGSTSEAVTTSDGVLRRVGVNLIPKPVCENVYRGVFGRQFNFDPNSLCAGGEPGRDTCNKDGGAPLTCINASGDRYLIGLSSWGYGCGRAGYPGVYTNITAFMPWIRSIVPV